MYKWFLAWRYLHTKLIAFFGVAAVSLCVAMVLVVLSVMGGFLDSVRTRSKGLFGDIVMANATLQGFPMYQEFTDYLLKELPDTVALSTPAINSYGVFRVPATTQTVPTRIMGICLDDYARVTEFGEGLHYERYYPGTTSLEKQQIPVAGHTASGKLELPKELEEANRQWRAAETNPKAIETFDELPYVTVAYPLTDGYSSERMFAEGLGEPGYRNKALPGAILGCDLVFYRNADGRFSRHLARGATVAVTLMPLSTTGNVGGEPPVKLLMRYSDDSHTGIFEVDSLQMYVDFQTLQHKLAMDPQERMDGTMTRARTNQLLIKLKEGVGLNEGKAAIQAAWMEFLVLNAGVLDAYDIRLLGSVRVSTWEDLQRDFIAAVEKEKVLVTSLFGLISMVAVVLVGCIFYMIVEKKTRDIGIVKALGGSARGVAALFVAYAGAVGIVGAILGVFLGCLFVWNVNDIQDLLAQLNPQLRIWSPDVYSFDKIPEVVKQADAVWVGVMAIVASMVGSLVPAILAARVWPVKALRYE